MNIFNFHPFFEEGILFSEVGNLESDLLVGMRVGDAEVKSLLLSASVGVNVHEKFVFMLTFLISFK